MIEKTSTEFVVVVVELTGTLIGVIFSVFEQEIRIEEITTRSDALFNIVL